MRVEHIVDEVVKLFEESEVPKDFRFEGQTFYERAEAWVLHAVDQLEEELASPDDAEDD